MEKNLKSIKIILPFILIFTTYLLVTIVIFRHRLLNINTYYGMPDVDSDGTIWYFWARLFAEKNNLNFNLNNLFFSYPYGYDISYIPFFSLNYEIAIKIINFIGFSWRNIILIINTSLIITYAASAFSAFLLAYYLTRNKYSGLIAGFIFSFSFYHILMGRGYIAQNHFEFIPLYFLSLFYFLDKKNVMSLVLSGLAFAIMFLANSYWAFFSLIFSLPILLFYRRGKISEKIKSMLFYYFIVLGTGILIHINFFFQELYVFNPILLKISGKAYNPAGQVVSLLDFFAPSANNIIYKNFVSGNNFLGYTAILLGLSGVFFIKKIENYTLLLFSFLLSILLASNIPGLFFLNEIYFNYFSAFRAVSRLNIFSSLFLSLMAALTVKYFFIKYRVNSNKKKLFLTYTILLLVCIFIILEGLNWDRTWRKTTDFGKIARLYEPIRVNPDVNVIAGYPMNLTNGTNGMSPNYERLGQVIHGKSMVGGLSPFLIHGDKYFNSMRDIEKNETIDYLSKIGVDTIIIYKDILKNSNKIIAKLRVDKRLNYIGDYKSYYDDRSYISLNDLARNFSVFQIKDVVARNKSITGKKVLIENLDGGTYEYKKVSAVKYQVSLKNIKGKINLVLDEPYSDKWRMYEGENNFLGDLSYTYRREIYENTHKMASIYKNKWTIDPKYVKQNVSKNNYMQNPDGSIDMTLILFFKPQSYTYLGQIVSGTTLVGCLLYLAYVWINERLKNTMPSTPRP